MSTTAIPGPQGADRLPTGEALARARALLEAIDHGTRTLLDAEARLGLVTQVVAFARQVEALRAVIVAEADRARAAESVRGTSIRSLLATSAQVTAGEASGWVYAGKELTGRAGVRQAALAGEVSVAQARAIDKVLGELPALLTDAQRARAEQLMLDKAHLMDAKGLADQTTSVLREVAPEVDAVEDQLSRLDAQRKRAWAARSLAIVPDGRGSLTFRGSLPTLEGEAFQRLVASYTVTTRQALARAVDRLDPDAEPRTFEQRHADGLIALVNAHSTALPSAGDAAAGPRQQSSGGRRATLHVTMSLDLLLAKGEQAGLLVDGQEVSAGELRRLLCDGTVIPVVLGAASEPPDVGRERRLVTADIRRALALRDGGCAFPGCQGAEPASEAHHVVPWWAGGVTAVSNLVLLCPYHHGIVEPLRFWTGSTPTRWQVRMDADGYPEFLPPARPGQAVAPTPVRHQRTSERLRRAEGGFRGERGSQPPEQPPPEHQPPDPPPGPPSDQPSGPPTPLPLE